MMKLQKSSTQHRLKFCNWKLVRERAVQIELAGRLLGTPRLDGRGKSFTVCYSLIATANYNLSLNTTTPCRMSHCVLLTECYSTL